MHHLTQKSEELIAVDVRLKLEECEYQTRNVSIEDFQEGKLYTKLVAKIMSKEQKMQRLKVSCDETMRWTLK